MRLFIRIAGILVIVVIAAGLALPGFGDYTPRQSVSKALAFIGKGRDALESSCAAGTFASKRALTEIGLPEADAKQFVLRTELRPVAPGTLRLKTVLTDIHGYPFFGLFPWKVIDQGSHLEHEFACSTEKKFSSRFTGTTIEPKYLPAGLRN